MCLCIYTYKCTWCLCVCMSFYSYLFGIMVVSVWCSLHRMCVYIHIFCVRICTNQKAKIKFHHPIKCENSEILYARKKNHTTENITLLSFFLLFLLLDSFVVPIFCHNTYYLYSRATKAERMKENETNKTQPNGKSERERRMFERFLSEEDEDTNTYRARERE